MDSYFIIVANAIRLGALLATGWEYGMLLSINVASSAQIMQAIILFIITKQCIKLYFLRDKNLNIKLIVKLFLAVVFLISVLYLYFVKAFVMWIGISHYAEEVMSRLYQYLIWLWPSFISLLSIWSAWDDIHKSANINSKL